MLFRKVIGLLEDGALLEEVGQWRWGLKFYGLATLPVCSLFPVLPRYEEGKNSVHIPLLAWGCLLPHGLLHNGFTLSNRQQISLDPEIHFLFSQVLCAIKLIHLSMCFCFFLGSSFSYFFIWHFVFVCLFLLSLFLFPMSSPLLSLLLLLSSHGLLQYIGYVNVILFLGAIDSSRYFWMYSPSCLQ